MKRLPVIVLAALLLFPLLGNAKTLVSQQEALRSAFPAGTEIRRETIFLTRDEVERAQKLGGTAVTGQLLVRYAGIRGGRTIGWAYFDVHRVRTLPETVMIVVTPQSTISKIEILSWGEPAEYMPKRRWLDQVHGQGLTEELALERSIRPITGASLSGHAIVNASRKILALHATLAASRQATIAGKRE